MKKRVTLSDIARVARLHKTTVSMALRNDTRIREATRKKVASIAVRMGYVPDPMLKALSVYRTANRPPAFQATLAWINNSPQRISSPAFTLTEYHDGARARSVELGYKLEDFWTHDPKLREGRLYQILRYRNISGLIIAPQPWSHASLSIPWEDFSAVTFGYSLVAPQLHSVTNHQFRTMRRTMHELRKLGYRRIGLWLFEEHDRRVSDNWSAGFLVDSRRIAPKDWVEPVFFQSDNDVSPEVFSRWLAKERPEAVVTGDSRVKDWLAMAGWRVPEQIGLSYLSVNPSDQAQSGTYENNIAIGAAAVDLVVDMIHRNERGIPNMPRWLLVDSTWHDGQTLRKLPRAI